MNASRFTNICRKLSELYALLLLTVFLLFCCDYETITRTKTKIYLFGTALYVLLSGIFLLRARLFGRRGDARFKPDVQTWLVSAYLVLTVLSALCSPCFDTFLGGERRQGLATITLYLCSFLLLRRFFRPKRWLLDAFAVAICLLCLLGSVQLTGANPLGLFPQGLNYYDESRAYYGSFWSTLGNVMSGGAVLSAAAGAFAAAFLFRRRSSEQRYALPLMLCVFSLAELEAEGGLVALLAVVVFLPAVAVHDGKRFCAALQLWGLVLSALGATMAVSFYNGGVTVVFAPETVAVVLCGGLLYALGALLPPQRMNGLCTAFRIFTIGLICAAGAAVYFCRTLPEGTLQEAHEILHGRWNDGFGSGRVGIWRQTWTLAKQSPLLGGGPDTLGQRGIVMQHYRPYLGITVVRTVDAAHHEYLNILVNQGAPALAMYLGILGVSFFRIRKSGTAGAICGAAAVAYAIQALFGIADCLCTPYFWFALAVVNQKNGRETV